MTGSENSDGLISPILLLPVEALPVDGAERILPENIRELLLFDILVC